MSEGIVMNGLTEQLRRMRPEVDSAIAKVLDHGQFIMGPEVFELEKQLQNFCGSRHAITCANGTDALQMIMMAKGIGPGDAVICPAFTFTATPEAIAIIGATPVFCDVLEDTFNIDSASIPRAAEAARSKGLVPRAVIAVDLFGQPADYEAVGAAASADGLWVLADAAQSFGATYKDVKVGRHGLATSVSFFPAKPLGCFGDGGAILTDDDELAEILRSIRVHGKGTDKYDNVRIGLNSRLDTIQAAILIQKMTVFDDEIFARNGVADAYNSAFRDVDVATPFVLEDGTSVWAQYTLRVSSAHRDAIRSALAEKNIPTAVYYPRALSGQLAYAAYPLAHGEVPVSQGLPAQVLSLPMHPYLAESDVAQIVAAVSETLQRFS
jgi:dTDP-4-amino-4,6-dideoxygalactose transaminase